MSFFDNVLLSSICVLFPILVYVIYLAYSNVNNYCKNFDDTIFEFVLLSSIFLLIKLNGETNNIFTIIFINIPLLFSYIRNKKVFSLLLSTVIIIYVNIFLNYNIFLLLVEYLSYFILHFIFYKQNKKPLYTISWFTLVKAFFFSLHIYYTQINSNIIEIFNPVFIVLISFYICSFLYYYLLLTCEQIVDLNNTFKQLEKEKTLRNSLFKLTHEIKNPIAVCKGYLDMIDLDNKKKSKRYVNIIKSEIDRSLNVISDFMEYSKVKINKEIFDLVMLMDEIYDSFEILLKDKNIKFNYENKYDEIYLWGDFDRLKQVFVNVIKNSIEAIEDDGIINMNVLLSEKKAIITLSDNGSGMDEDTLNNVKEMFFTTKRNGTGLGVALSNEIIVAHGGTLRYESKKGKGTKCIIELPI